MKRLTSMSVRASSCADDLKSTDFNRTVIWMLKRSTTNGLPAHTDLRHILGWGMRRVAEWGYGASVAATRNTNTFIRPFLKRFT